MALKLVSPRPRDPACAHLDVGSLHGGPGNAMCRLFLADVAGMSRISVIESLAIDVLGVIRQMRSDGIREIAIGWIGHSISSEVNAPGF